MSNSASNVVPFDLDRRQYRRFPILESGLLHMDELQVDCQVIDVSANGVRVRPVGYVPKPKTKCRFMLARLGMFDAQVCWQDDDSIGIRFAEAPEHVAERVTPVAPVAVAGVA